MQAIKRLLSSKFDYVTFKESYWNMDRYIYNMLAETFL